MMMMDIGMYGHGHNHHGNSYNSESNFYNYTEATSQHTSTHHPSSYQYDDQQSFMYISDHSETPPSPNDLNYFTQQVHPENPIINTETGLSYTNLDYGHSSTVYSHSSYESYQRGQQDILLRHHEDVADSNGHHTYNLVDNKYHHLGHDIGYHQHLVSAASSPNSCMEYQQIQRYKEEVVESGDSSMMKPHHHIHSVNPVPSQQLTLPTYKWMQVKRNVPKPTVCNPFFTMMQI
ncbi:hypothetical protein HHI36_017014 [Cryptolaemus montrouzieri]|uniref:Uncharacterized protein n=1 Tax=Cryptolaemus montrouzieri TaxID=559131 RepID=A0ABD2NLL8_9CUCU